MMTPESEGTTVLPRSSGVRVGAESIMNESGPIGTDPGLAPLDYGIKTRTNPAKALRQ